MKRTYRKPEIQTTAIVVHRHLLVGSDSETTIPVDKNEEIEENFSRRGYRSLWDEPDDESDDEF